jgi:hypothetical protein
VGGERFAVESCFVRAVLPSAERRDIPGQPAHQAGLGFLSPDRASPIFDLASMLGSGLPAGSSPCEWILALGRDQVEIGLLSEGEPRWRREAALAPIPWRLPHRDVEMLLGMTYDGVLVVKGAALLDDARFRIVAGRPEIDAAAGLEGGAA